MEQSSQEKLKSYLKLFIRDMIPFKFGKKYYYDDFVNIYFISRGMVYLLSENGHLDLQSGQRYDDQSEYNHMGNLNHVFKKYISKFISSVMMIGTKEYKIHSHDPDKNFDKEFENNIYFVSNFRIYSINEKGVVNYLIPKPNKFADESLTQQLCYSGDDIINSSEIRHFSESYYKKNFPHYIATLKTKYNIDLDNFQELFTDINTKINYFGPYLSNFWKRFFYHKEDDNIYVLNVIESKWSVYNDKEINREIVNSSLTEVKNDNFLDKNKMIKFNYVYGHYKYHYLYRENDLIIIYGIFDNDQSWYILPRKYHDQIINNLEIYFPKKTIDKLKSCRKNTNLPISEAMSSGMGSIRSQIAKSPRNKSNNKIPDNDQNNITLEKPKNSPKKNKNSSKKSKNSSNKSKKSNNKANDADLAHPKKEFIEYCEV